MAKHKDWNRWYKIGFDEGRLMGSRFDPPYEKGAQLIDAYKSGYTDAKKLG